MVFLLERYDPNSRSRNVTLMLTVRNVVKQFFSTDIMYFKPIYLYMLISVCVRVCAPHVHGNCQHSTHFAQEMDKYGKSVENRSAHCGDRETNTGRLSQKQRKRSKEKEENKTKPIVELSSSQEETTPLGSPCPDWNKPTQQLSYDQTDARGKGGGRSTCLHHRNTQTTGDLARNRNRERDSSHSAPTLNSETVAATLINAKNDITSRRTRAGPSSLAHAAGAKSTARAHAQLMDIIDRVKKLEDLQHVRNVELQSKVGVIGRKC